MSAQYELQYAYEVERVTITIDKATLARIRQIAGSRGVSKFIADAARERAGQSEILEMLNELDAKYGRVPPHVLAATDRDMRKIFGMPPPTKPWNPYADRPNTTAPRAKARTPRKARKAGSRARGAARGVK